jgi:hypothetical protein
MSTESSPHAAANATSRSLVILEVGHCEPLKAVVHGAALGLAALMAVYNAAAWLRRRQRHLAVNAIIYVAAVWWEQRRVADHLVPCLPHATPADRVPDEDEPVDDRPRAA